jgi:hypothetical protein
MWFCLFSYLLVCVSSTSGYTVGFNDGINLAYYELGQREVCQRDDCLRAFLRYSASATIFCTEYTLAPLTASPEVPIFATPCSGVTSRLSSACSCVNTAHSTQGSMVTSHSGGTTSTMSTMTVTSEASTSTGTTASLASSTESNTGCFSVTTTVPLLTVPSNDTTLPAFSAFAGLAGRVTILQALEFNTSSYGSFLVAVIANSTSFDVVSPDGHVIMLSSGSNNSFQASLLSISACSTESLLKCGTLKGVSGALNHRAIFQHLDSRQGSELGGTNVTLDVVNVCNQPVTGLSPLAGSGQTLRLLFTSSIGPNQNPGMFNCSDVLVLSLTPVQVFGNQGSIYPSNRLIEGPPGQYIGYCPFPPAMTCSSIAEAISNFCDIIEPLAENAALVCAPLLFIFPEAPGLVELECIVALNGL